MEKITQSKIKEVLQCETATVSRYLSGKRDIKLNQALKVKETLQVPVEIFVDPSLQIKYFGKSFIKNDTKNSGSCATTS
jgi:predicted transcriptional regulator